MSATITLNGWSSAAFTRSNRDSNDQEIISIYNKRMQTVRLLAILSVVWAHCYPNFGVNPGSASPVPWIGLLLLQAGHIGTVLFFLLSGYFISEKIKTFSLKQFLQYRFRSLIIPWLIFLGLVTIIQLFYVVEKPSPILLLHLISGNIFYAAYWFIPVSVIVTSLFVIMKRHIDHLWFGLLLAMVTLFYGLNLYTHWTSTNYVNDFMAYGFFLWLGIQTRRHVIIIGQIIHYLQRETLLALLFALLMAACYETANLARLGHIDTVSSLRISSQLLAVIVFALLLGYGTGRAADRLQPQRYTYGIYLIHCLVILLSRPFFASYVAAHLGTTLTTGLFFAFVVLTSYGLSALLKRSPLRWLTGNIKKQDITAAKSQDEVILPAAIAPQPVFICPLPFLTHYDRSVLEFYTSGDGNLVSSILTLAGKEFRQNSEELEMRLINDDREGLKLLGRRIEQTATAIGFRQLSELARLYEYANDLDVDQIDQLVLETCDEIGLLEQFFPFKVPMKVG